MFKNEKKKSKITWFSAGVLKGKTVPTQSAGKNEGRWRWNNLSPRMVPWLCERSWDLLSA